MIIGLALTAAATVWFSLQNMTISPGPVVTITANEPEAILPAPVVRPMIDEPKPAPLPVKAPEMRIVKTLETPQPNKDSEKQPTPKSSITYHYVQNGETLSDISKNYYGTVRKWREIYEANRNTLFNGPDRLKVGSRLIIPE